MLLLAREKTGPAIRAGFLLALCRHRQNTERPASNSFAARVPISPLLVQYVNRRTGGGALSGAREGRPSPPSSCDNRSALS
jgi:hypothetical protein